MDDTNRSYSKNYFTPRNILIYIILAVIVYGLVYFLFLSKKDSTNPYTTATPTSAPVTGSPTGTTMMSSSFALSEVNSSGETGNVMMTEKDGKTTVELTMTGEPTGASQPAHIHKGSCPTVGAIVYPLNDVVNGKSTTVLDASIATIKAGMPLALNVHKSTAEITKYVSCGNLK